MMCPGAEKWRAFLDGDLSDDEQAAFNEHLESCDECPKLLESLAAGKETWQGTAEQLSVKDEASDPADSDRLRDVMDQLKNADLDAPRTVSPESLTFLSPSENEDAIGQLGHYEILEIIGAGGMGIVLKAWDPSLRRIVAIKVLATHLANSASARRRFVREAQAAAAVSHDHVVPIHAVEAECEPPFLVMHYVEGRTLQMRIDHDGPLELREVLRIGEQTARGLAAAHEQGIIHRDIKPSNILLENGVERVRITDFGLARAIDDASMTQSGVLAGTPLFMAPEQAQGEPLDHRADLFSLGSLLYAMCTGRSPFRSSTIMGVIRRVCDDQPRPIREINPDIPDWFCRIVDRLLSKKPHDRFQSAEQVASLLSGCLAHVHQPLSVLLPGGLTSEVETEKTDAKKTAAPETATAETSTRSEESVVRKQDAAAEVPPVRPPLDEATVENVLTKLRDAAPKMKWSAVLNVVIYLAFLCYVAEVSPGEVDDVSGIVGFGLLSASLMYYGSLRLARGDSQGWPTVAAISCYLSVPGWPLGLPAAIRTWRTLRDENVEKYFLERQRQQTPPGKILTGRQIAALFALGLLNTLASRRVWVSLSVFAVSLSLIIIDLSTFHFMPMLESLITPVCLVGLVIVFGVFCAGFNWKRNRKSSTSVSFGAFVASLVLLMAQAMAYGLWVEQIQTMGYVQVRVPTREARVTLQRAGRNAELSFGATNNQTVRIPAGTWQWHVHMGDAGPLMSGPLTVESSRVNIFAPSIPRGRDLIDGVYAVKVFDRKPVLRNLAAIPEWLGGIPSTVTFQKGQLRMSFPSADDVVWETRLDVDPIAPGSEPEVKIDLLHRETSVVEAIGSVGFSESEIVLRLGFPDQPRAGSWRSSSGQPNPQVTYRLIRQQSLAALHGSWKPLAELTAGKEVRGAGHIAQTMAAVRIPGPSATYEAMNYVWQFSGDNLSSRIADEDYMTGTVKVDDSTRPARLTWDFGDGLNFGTLQMIYRLRRDAEGELLEVSFRSESVDFPIEFESTTDNGQHWILFRRQE